MTQSATYYALPRVEKRSSTFKVIHDQTECFDAYEFLIDARIFLQAGDRLHDEDWALAEPQAALYAHSIELSFKALLRHNGISLDDLKNRKKFGHDLNNLNKACASLGLKLEDSDFEDVISGLRDPHYYRSFHYPEKKFQFPLPNRCSRIAHLLFKKVESMCGPDPLKEISSEAPKEK